MSTTVELWKIEEAMRQAERRLEAADKLAAEVEAKAVRPYLERLARAYREAGDE